MNSIFDENSEFLKYLKDTGSIDEPNPLPTSNPSSTNANPVTPKTGDHTYVLDLKAHSLTDPGPVEEVPIKKQSSNPNASAPTPTQPNPKLKKLNKLEPSLSMNSNLAKFFIDKLKFILVSGLIFVVTFMAINWSAYSKIFYNWYSDIAGTETPLTQFIGDPNAPAIAKDLDLVENTNIPKLDLEVTPPGTRIIIPKLQSNVPVVSVSTNTLISKNWDALEKDIQEALRSGVVHYPGTPFPNQSGNVVLTGHSSYYPWDPGRFKDVFAVLHQAAIGDEIIMFYNQKKYTYKISDIKIVLPTEVDVLGDTGDNRLTLITCTPIGTNLKRLIVTAKPVQ